ncbi:MAG TPA: aminotransferase class IV [Acidobacteriota bacterium]|nr:aminotransferase class IV [Acidobacteriota bacterium]
MQIVNIDGTLYSAEDAKISVFDHGFLYGDNIYETLRTYRGRIFLIERHLLRLQLSAEFIQLTLPLNVKEFQKELERTAAEGKNQESYIRLIVTRGRGAITLDPDRSERASFVIIVNPLEPYPREYYEKGVKVAMVSIRRNDRQTLNPRIKSGNLLNNVLAFAQAKSERAFEGILCNLAGNVTEATSSNVFIVKNEILITPSLESGLLSGVTRGLVLELAASKQIPIEERDVHPSEMMQCDECFITSTTKGVMPVNQISERQLKSAPGAVTRQVMEAYQQFVDERY